MMSATPLIALKHKPNFIYGYQVDLACPAIELVIEIHDDINGINLDVDEVNSKITELTNVVSIHHLQVDSAISDINLKLIQLLIEWNLTLHKAAGLPMIYAGKGVPVRQLTKNVFTLAIPCMDGNHLITVKAFVWLLSVFNNILRQQPNLNQEKEFKFIVKKLSEYAPKGINTTKFIESAIKLGIPWSRVQQNVIQYGWGSQSQWMDSSFTENTSLISSRLARNKVSTAAILRNSSIPVPDHLAVKSVDDATKFAIELGYPVVVKPIDQDGGNGVSAGLMDEASVRDAFAKAVKFSKNVLVEKHIAGDDYRLQVFRGELIWVSHRQPGGVTGDGKSTVNQLVTLLNSNPKRGEAGTNALLKKIEIDEEALGLLKEQQLTIKSKPALGQFVRLRRTANVATGGTPTPVMLNDVHPDNKKLVELAAKLLRLDFAGVDLIIPDIKTSWLESGAAICEVNAQPQIWPQLTEELLKKIVNKQGRIPTIFALGTKNHRDWINHLVDDLGKIGCRVGVAENNQASVGPDVVVYHSKHLLQSAKALQANKDVDCLILCVDDTSLASIGLPSDRFDLLMLLDGPSEANQMKQWINFTQILSRTCHGAVVVNAESEQLRNLVESFNNQSVKIMSLFSIHNFVVDNFHKTSALVKR